MIYIEEDLIVGLTVKGIVTLNKLFNKENEDVTFTIADCIKKRERCRTCGAGDVGESYVTADDIKRYLRQWSDVFELLSDGSYIFHKEKLYDENWPDNINYGKLLSVGSYNGYVLDTLNYPSELPKDSKKEKTENEKENDRLNKLGIKIDDEDFPTAEF